MNKSTKIIISFLLSLLAVFLAICVIILINGRNDCSDPIKIPDDYCPSEIVIPAITKKTLVYFFNDSSDGRDVLQLQLDHLTWNYSISNQCYGMFATIDQDFSMDGTEPVVIAQNVYSKKNLSLRGCHT